MSDSIEFLEDRADLVIDRIIRRNKRSLKAIKLSRTRITKINYGGEIDVK